MSEPPPVGQLVYSRQQETDTVKNPADAEVHEDGTAAVVVPLDEHHEKHNREEHVATEYHKHIEGNN